MSEQYVDVRELLPQFQRHECKFCGHGWIRDEQDRPNYGQCPECHWTQGEEYMADVYGVEKVVSFEEGVEYVEL